MDSLNPFVHHYLSDWALQCTRKMFSMDGQGGTGVRRHEIRASSSWAALPVHVLRAGTLTPYLGCSRRNELDCKSWHKLEEKSELMRGSNGIITSTCHSQKNQD